MTEKKLLSQRLANFLLACRPTPHAMAGETPTMLLMGRNIRTRLDVLKPIIRKRVEKKQRDQELRSSHSPTRKLDVGQALLPETIVEETRGCPESSQPTLDPCPTKSESHPIQFGGDISINSESLP